VKPPRAPKRPQVTTLHGRTLVDDYAWLRDASNPEVRAYLEAENAYADAMMADTVPGQDCLYDEMVRRMPQTDETVPSRDGDYWYYSRTEGGRQYLLMCRRKGDLAAPEELLLDLNELASGTSYLHLAVYEVSDDGRLLAYATDTTGYRQNTMRIKDLITGAILPVCLERVVSAVWATDNRTLLYLTEDAVTKRTNQCWRWTIDTHRSELMHDERDLRFGLRISRSLDRQMFFLTSSDKTTRECLYLRAATPFGAFRRVLAREDGHVYEVSHFGGRFFIRTNRLGPNFGIVTAEIADSDGSTWSLFIDHDAAVRLERLDFFAGHLVVTERENGLAQLRVVDMASAEAHRIPVNEPNYVLSLDVNREFDTRVVRFSYQSLATPLSIYEYDMQTRERSLLKRQEVPDGYDPSEYETRRIWAPARDGVRVPVSMVFKKDVPLDGRAPLLLHGYGAYGASAPAAFSASRLGLLDRGVIYAIAHVRGGGELGEGWRQQGRMDRKLNSFHDFIDCADHLVKQQYTSHDRLAIHGASAGGLLVTAVANMRPELFAAVVAEVPFVDVLNSMLDGSLPLTVSEYAEWGNPEDRAAFEYLRAYSPYDNIKSQDYPPALVVAGLNDSQIPFWESAKYAARLRATSTCSNAVLLKTDMAAGHSGPSGRYEALRRTALIHAFVLQHTGKP
jgi:oligopeptidase B